MLFKKAVPVDHDKVHDEGDPEFQDLELCSTAPLLYPDYYFADACFFS